VRRIALVALATVFLLVPAASAQHTSTVQVHNRSTHDLMIVAEVGHSETHHKLFPHGYLVLNDVRDNSCVRIHLAHSLEHFDHCRPTPSPVDLACNLPPDRFACLLHPGAEKELVVTVDQPLFRVHR